jgi:LCP family protein required for cell wall assembly
MKPTEIKPIGHTVSLTRSGRDRLTPLLLWLAFFLIAGLAAIITDLWVQPTSDEPVVAALVGLTLPESTQPPSPISAETLAVPASLPAFPAMVQAEPLLPVTPPACVPPDNWDIHMVQPGNTLDSLARRYETDVDTLMHVNCLNTQTIFSGQRLYVPGPTSGLAVPTPFATQHRASVSTPQPGASVASIADMAPTATPQPAFPLTMPDDYINIVLLGSDKRPTSGAWRTDSMIIVSVDTASKIVRLLSIPRDLWVYIPGHGYNRVNTADLWGELAEKGTGPERVKQTIHQNLGIPIHYYVRVDFQGFIKIIDAVGGIEVDVDCPLPDIELSAGIHQMNGTQALWYARSRYGTSDFDRGRRQRKVLMALWDQALTLDIIPRLPQLWWTMANSFQTDLTLDQVINLAYVGVQLKPQRILSRSIGPSHVQSWMTPQGAAVLLPNQQAIRAMLESFYAPVDTALLDAKDKVSVELLNGSPRSDADQLAAAALRWAGFKVTSGGPADHQDYAQTQIAVHRGDMATAQQIADELMVPSAVILDPAAAQEQLFPVSSADMQVILGRDYDPCQR